MKPLLAALALLFLAAAAHGQPVPSGSGQISFKEKLKTDCGTSGASGTLTLTLFPNATWTIESLPFDFGGTLSPADPLGRSWNLAFDGASLTAYELYLESVAEEICATPVSISDMEIGIQLKLGKDGTQASLQVKTSATGVAAIFAGKGKHQLKGKGVFAPSSALVASPAHGAGATIFLQSYPWYETP